MKIYVLKSERLSSNSSITDRFSPILYFCYVDYMIAINWIDSETVDLVNNIHLHFSMSIAVVSIIDALAIGLMIE
jgi:hypothetical protein